MTIFSIFAFLRYKKVSVDSSNSNLTISSAGDKTTIHLRQETFRPSSQLFSSSAVPENYSHFSLDSQSLGLLGIKGALNSAASVLM